jgi:hypothetical protein
MARLFTPHLNEPWRSIELECDAVSTLPERFRDRAPSCYTVVLHRQKPAVRETPVFEGLLRCPKPMVPMAEREGFAPILPACC